MMPLVVGLAFLCGGCVQVKMIPFLDQALILKEFSVEKDAQHKFVKLTDERFDKMREAAQSGAILKYKTAKDIVSAFGQPILIEGVTEQGVILERYLYRHAISKGENKKVYLYFNPQGGALTRWELL